ncbi:MAG: hypothetical protein JXB10_07680 [Pirellulales bacterium]|nr:hypothetical protein [Pirellulales bacterium]
MKDSNDTKFCPIFRLFRVFRGHLMLGLQDPPGAFPDGIPFFFAFFAFFAATNSY